MNCNGAKALFNLWESKLNCSSRKLWKSTERSISEHPRPFIHLPSPSASLSKARQLTENGEIKGGRRRRRRIEVGFFGEEGVEEGEATYRRGNNAKLVPIPRRILRARRRRWGAKTHSKIN